MKRLIEKRNVFAQRFIELKWLWQRLTRGFSDYQIMDLDRELALWILPRLKRFKEIDVGTPSDLNEEQWNQVLADMIFAFDDIVNEVNTDFSHDPDRRKRGLDLFRKYYHNLWI